MKRVSKKLANKQTQILDSFTVEKIKDWRKTGNIFVRIQAELYASLAAQRSVVQERLLKALSSSASESLEFNNWVRIVPYEYSDMPLSVKGSILSDPGGRFNIGEIDDFRFPRFSALYVAENRKTAMAEYFGQSGAESGLEPHEFSLRDTRSISIVSVRGKLDSYLDLTSAASLKLFVSIAKHFKVPNQLRSLAKKLGIKPARVIESEAELMTSLLDPDWRALPAIAGVPANCQTFGHFVQASGIEGILFPSVRGEANCLAIFPINFRGTASFVEILPPHPHYVTQPRIDATLPKV